MLDLRNPARGCGGSACRSCQRGRSCRGNGCTGVRQKKPSDHVVSPSGFPWNLAITHESPRSCGSGLAVREADRDADAVWTRREIHLRAGAGNDSRGRASRPRWEAPFQPTPKRRESDFGGRPASPTGARPRDLVGTAVTRRIAKSSLSGDRVVASTAVYPSHPRMETEYSRLGFALGICKVEYDTGVRSLAPRKGRYLDRTAATPVPRVWETSQWTQSNSLQDNDL